MEFQLSNSDKYKRTKFKFNEITTNEKYNRSSESDIKHMEKNFPIVYHFIKKYFY